jgi:hypothetical protein
VQRFRDLQDPRGGRLPLLLEHVLDVHAGHRDGLHDVRERLHGERLAVGDHAVAFTVRRRGV